MSDKNDSHNAQAAADRRADALAAVVVVLIPVIAVIYWLSGLPTS